MGESIVPIRDHGPGVRESDLERIFEAFYRVAAARDSDCGDVDLRTGVRSLHHGFASRRCESRECNWWWADFPFANASADDHMAAALARGAKARIRDGYAA